MLTITHENASKSMKARSSIGSSEVRINNTISNNSVTMEAIGIALTSVFKREKLYKLIVALTTDILKAKYASLMIIEGDKLKVKYSNHLSEEIMRESSVKIGTGISGCVALKGMPLLVKDIESSTRFIKRNNEKYSSKSFISMPLIVNERIIGVVNVNDKNNDELFNEDDVRMLKVVSKYSAIAIRNATLIEKTRKHTIVQELKDNYYDKSNKFLPVTLKSLMIGPFNKSELFLEDNSNGKRNYILYWNGGDRLFTSEKREEFIRKNINRLYVPKNGRAQYLRFMETNLDRVIDDQVTSQEEKVDVIKDVAVNIIGDLIAVPGEACNIERSKQLIRSLMNLISSSQNDYAGLISARTHSDQYLDVHSLNVTIIGLIFARYLGMNIEAQSEFGLGLLLQDIGMKKVDPVIFNKPTKLNSAEYEIMRKHAEIGFHLLQETGKVSTESCLLALLHHENYNGSGYPYGLKGNDINYYGRISRVVDVYNALTSDRPYAKAGAAKDACKIMEENMNGVFDSGVLQGFVDFLKSAGILQR